MGKKSILKGKRGENDAAKLLHPIFPDAERNLEETRNDDMGYDLINTGAFLPQVKFRKEYVPVNKIEEVVYSPDKGEIPCLLARANYKKEIIVFYLDDFVRIVQDIDVMYNPSPYSPAHYVSNRSYGYERKVGIMLYSLFNRIGTNGTDTLVGTGNLVVKTWGFKKRDYAPINKLYGVPSSLNQTPCLVTGSGANNKRDVIMLFASHFIEIAKDVGVIYN